MVLHLPMMKTIVPGNVSMLMSIIFPIVAFDILENDKGIDASLIFEFPEENADDILDQMEDIGYGSYISILNLCTIFFVMMVYFA